MKHVWLATLMVLGSFCAVAAEESNEAQKIVDQALAVLAAGPYSLHLSMDMDFTDQAMSMRMKMHGTTLIKDEKHANAKMVVESTMKQGENPEQSSKMDMLVVVDGETIWADMQVAEQDMHQVIKANYEQMSELVAHNARGAKNMDNYGKDTSF